ncbi:unnamed protein product [Auanema sp. JU1783]|nr:unnamed protein product [Auanema sp. JU1783]
MSYSKVPLIWIDCEMTGLNYEKQTLVEIAAIVTDADLNVISEGPNIVIHQDDKTLDAMDDWCKKTFAENGLLERIKSSTVSMQEAENQVLSFVEEHTKRGQCPLAGNSIYMDKLFIQKYMPRLANHFHYRLVDVSTIKELSRRWYPHELKSAPAKAMTHRALDDIRESINELKYYRTSVFKP